MGRRCIIKSCRNSKGAPTDTVHCFPRSNPFQLRRWMQFVNLSNNVDTNSSNVDNFGLCSRHFSSNMYRSDDSEFSWKSTDRKKLKSEAFPTRFGEHDFIEDVINRQEMLSSDHTYCKPVDIKMLHNTEVEALKWKLDEKDRQVQERDAVIKNLRQALSTAQIRCEQLEKKLSESISTEDNTLLAEIKKIMSPPQIRMLTHPENKYVQWSQQERAQLIALHSISSKAYNYLRTKMHFPLATEPSIYRWLQNAEVIPDKILAPVMNILETLMLNAPQYLRQCGLALDEMSIDSRYCYDPKEDKVYGKEKNVTVFTVRGLLSNWKQVIYFTFNSNISMDLLNDIIRALHKVGANVCSLTTDMGPKNQRLWKEYGVGIVKDGVVHGTSFDNVVSKQRIHIFPDLPHLVKLFRNHILDDGITFSDGVILNRDLFLELLRKQTSEFKPNYELSHKHVYVRGKQRQRVKPAFQLLSNRVAEAIKFTNPGNSTRILQATKIKFFNDFIDLANTRRSIAGKNVFQSPYGMFLEEQNKLLEQAHAEFSSMRVGQRKRKTLAPFQKGLIMYIHSLEGLLADLQMSPVNAKFLMTAKVNQDLLENAFSRIRGFGQFNMNPTAVECMHRIRKLMLSWNFSDSKVCPVQAENDTPSNLHPIFAKKSNKESNDGHVHTPFSAEILEKVSKINNEVEPVILCADNYGLSDRCEEGGIEYVTGYIATKFKESFPQLNGSGAGEDSKTFWVSRISNGQLLEPSVYWISLFKKLEEFFNAVHPFGGINMCKSICKNLQETISSRFPDVPLDIIKFYVRTRIHIRIKTLNRSEEDESFKSQARRQGIFEKHEPCVEGEEKSDESIPNSSEDGESMLQTFASIFS